MYKNEEKDVQPYLCFSKINKKRCPYLPVMYKSKEKDAHLNL